VPDTRLAPATILLELSFRDDALLDKKLGYGICP
jgi:hypothetical protein